MKTIVPFKKMYVPVITIVAFLISANVFSQGIPELQFINPVLESGTAGNDGAQYRFSNVTAGIDALVKIKGRSSSAVVLSTIDTVATVGMGFENAFQPVLGIPGTAPANSSWSMDFELSFVKAGTTSKTKVARFKATGLDIDGDGLTLSEWAIMNGMQAIDSALINSLTFTKVGGNSNATDYLIEGIIANSPGIDTTAKNVMATYTYLNQDKIDFTIGAKTSASTTTAGMRLNSIWFKDFLGVTLPVKLISFTASLNKNKTDLNWVTASETNTSKFIIQKSVDGRTFLNSGEVAAGGNTTNEITYTYTDNTLNGNAAVVYYRLCSVDLDGKTEYSDVKMIRLNRDTENNLSILTYPNPATNLLYVTIPVAWQNKNISYQLSDANGRLIKRIQNTSAGQTETFNLNRLSPGIYIISVNADGNIIQQKIVKS